MRLLIAGFPAFSSMFTVGSVGFWLSLYVQEVLGFSHSQTEALATAYFIALATGSVWAGASVDQTGKPWLFASIGLLLNAASITGMYLVRGFTPMLALRLVQGLGLSTSIPVALGSLSLIAGESRGVGLTSLFMSTGMALGSLVGGLIIGFAGYWALFASASLLSLLGALVSTQIRVARVTRPPSVRELARLLSGPVLVVLLGILARQTLATGVYALLSVYLRRLLGLTLVQTAVALTINPIVQGVLSLYVAEKSKRHASLLYPLGILLTSVVFIMLYKSSHNAPLAYAAMVLQGVSFALVNVSGNYLVITGLPREVRYTASSLFNFFFNVGWILGTGLTAAVFREISPLSWLPLSSAGLTVVALLVYLGLTVLRAQSPTDRPSAQA